MTSIIIIFGLLTLLAGVLILINPENIFGVLRGNIESLWLQITAIGVRVVLGISLILFANESKFPVTISILGWLSIAAAMTFLVIGRRRFIRLMTWAFTFLKAYGRVGGIFAAIFGGLLAYAFL